MNWSFRIGNIAGTDVKVHGTFLILLAFWAVAGYQDGGGAVGALVASAYLLTLFACVLLHEFGHILMARRFGVRTPDVLLLPIGGVARLERIPEEPRQELLIALAGPAVTLAIALAIGAWLVLSHTALPPLFSEQPSASFAADIWRVNVWLLLFNLVPAFPMDGGRVLRAILSSRLGLSPATRIAARIGQGLALAFGMYGLLNHEVWPVLIALFVFLGAGAEAAAVETRAAGRGITVHQMMVTRFETLPVFARLREAADKLLEGEQREFPVLNNSGQVEGILTRENLIRGLSQRGPDATVGEAMTPNVPAVQLQTDFETALAQLKASGLPALPVVDAVGALVGLLTLDNISDLILIRRAVRQA